MFNIFGPPDIEKLSAKRDIAGLVKALSYKKDKAVRINAAYALRSLGDGQAVSPLIAALKDEDFDVSVAAVECLGSFCDEHAVEAILQADPLYNNIDLSVKVASGLLAKDQKMIKLHNDVEDLVINTLVSIGSSAVPGLIHAVQTETNEKSGGRAIKVLGRLADPRSFDALMKVAATSSRHAPEAILALGELGDPRACDLLVEKTASANDTTRSYSIYVLGKLGDPRASEIALEMLNSANTFVLQHALLALGYVGDANCVEALISMLSHRDMNVVIAAIIALGKLRDERAVLLLMGLLGHSDEDICNQATNALAKIGTPAVLPAIETLQSGKKQERIAALQILGAVGDPRAVHPLIQAMKELDDDIHLLAWQALVDCGEPAIVPLLATLKDANDTLRKYITTIFVTMGEKAVATLITALACESEPSTSETISLSLAAIGEPAEPALKISLQGAGPVLSDQINEILKKIATQRLNRITETLNGEVKDLAQRVAVEKVLPLLKDIDCEKRETAAHILGLKGDRKAVKPLINALNDAETVVRLRAAEALGLLGDASAVEALRARLKDPSEEVRQAASQALTFLEK